MTDGLPDNATLQVMMTQAAKDGARQALESIGLHDETAGIDVRDLRLLIDGWREAKRAAAKAFWHWLTVGLLSLLALGAYMRMKT